MGTKLVSQWEFCGRNKINTISNPNWGLKHPVPVSKHVIQVLAQILVAKYLRFPASFLPQIFASDFGIVNQPNSKCITKMFLFCGIGYCFKVSTDFSQRPLDIIFTVISHGPLFSHTHTLAYPNRTPKSSQVFEAIRASWEKNMIWAVSSLHSRLSLPYSKDSKHPFNWCFSRTRFPMLSCQPR